MTLDFLELAGALSLEDLIENVSFYELDTDKYKEVIEKYMSENSISIILEVI